MKYAILKAYQSAVITQQPPRQNSNRFTRDDIAPTRRTLPSKIKTIKDHVMKSFTINESPTNQITEKTNSKRVVDTDVAEATPNAPGKLRSRLSSSLLLSDAVQPLVELVEEAEERATKPWNRRLPEDIEK